MSTVLVTQRCVLPVVLDVIEPDLQRLWDSNLAYCRLADELDGTDRVPHDHGRRFLEAELGRAGGRVHLYLRADRVAAMASQLVPHPRDGLPWIGLLRQ